MKKIISFILSVSISIGLLGTSVYAAEDMRRSDWGYFWLENYCGVDTSQIQNTDYGSSFSDIAQRYGTTTFDNSITAVQNQINNPSYDAFYDYVKTQTHNTYVTTDNLAHYVTQQGQRTVERTGKKLWDMSGSSFFNSLYNKFFNNNGYKEQYETIPGNANTYDDTENNISISVSGLGYTTWWRYPNSTNWGERPAESPFLENPGSLYGDVYGHNTNLVPIPKNTTTSKPDTNTDYIATVSCNGYTYYLGSGNLNYTVISSVKGQYFNSSGKVGFYVYFYSGQNVFKRFTFVVNANWNDNAVIGDGSSTVGLPSQIGGYFDENGNWCPLYTDPSLNPDRLVINPNGTVTLPTGEEKPIYIDPTEVSPEGQNQILQFWSDTPSDLNPYGYPWSQISLSPDGDGGFDLSGLGETLKSLFDDLLDNLKNGLEAILNGFSEVIKKLTDILDAILNLDWASEFQEEIDETSLDIDFNIIEDNVDKFFYTMLGLPK